MEERAGMMTGTVTMAVDQAVVGTTAVRAGSEPEAVEVAEAVAEVTAAATRLA